MSVKDLPVTKLYGVGSAKAAAYAKQGIYTVGDVLYNFPRAYENRGNVELLADIVDPEIKHSVILNVATQALATRIKRGMTILKFKA